MATELFIPQLGQTVESVTLISWLVEDGQSVDHGQPILEVETDKAVFPVEANASGFLHTGPYHAGDELPILTVVATIGEKEEIFTIRNAPSVTVTDYCDTPVESNGDVDQSQRKPPVDGLTTEERHYFVSPRARKLANRKKVNLSQVTATGGDGIRIIENDVVTFLSQIAKATPVAANMATELGLNLSRIDGTGTKGTITKSDIEKAMKKGALQASTLHPSTPATAEPADVNEVTKVIPLSGIRGIIFERMGNSVHTTARVTLVTEADATNFVTACKKIKECESDAWGFSPGYTELLAFIVARALRDFPQMNARVSMDGKAIDWLAQINLGVAVDTERGLLVPVIPNADCKGLREFGSDYHQVVERARAGRSLPDELTGGTFTITNLGMFDIDAFTPVINLPEAAILGVGRIRAKVVPYQEEIAVRQMLTLSLVFDHRLNDGAPAAQFLQRIKQYVENPILLIG